MIIRQKLLYVCAAIALAGLGSFAAESATQPEPAKSYQIRNQKYGDLLRPQNANNANGTPIVLYPAQPWKCMTWKFSSAGESGFQLQNHFTSKTFGAGTTGQGKPAPVAQVPFSKEKSETPAWQFSRLNDGTFKITDPKTGKALTAVEEANHSSVRVVLEAWSGGDNQKWRLAEVDPKSLTM